MDSNRVMKLAAVVGAAGAAAALGIGLFLPTQTDPEIYLGWHRGGEPAFPARETPEMTPDEHASALVPALTSEDAENRHLAREALGALLEQGTALAPSVQDDVALALAEMHRLSTGSTKSEIAERRECLTLLVAGVKGDAARAYAEQVLAVGDGADKKAVLEAMLEPGALRGKALFESAYELTKTAEVPESLKPAVIRRVRGKAAAEELMAFVRETKDRKALAAAAVEVQNLHRPELLGEVIARLDDEEMLKDAKQLPWFNGNLLAQHIGKAEGVELVRALRVVWARPSLTKQTFKSVQETLASADPAVRRMAARLVPDAVKYEALQADEGEKTLSARLDVETDPAVKGELEAVLGEVRRNRRPAETAVVETPLTEAQPQNP
ncbi:MAG: hypothetical protein HY928_03480 [Elusimicrobia bacterium]|nr:hypothetical protein [Elusimicrobiota bacterium]